MQFTTDSATYTSLEVIGKGGFGTVYKVEDEHGKIYALKHATFSSPAKRKAFAGEFSIVNALDHEHIIKVIDGTQSESEACMVMPYVPGTLRDVLEQEFPEPQGLDIVWDWLGYDKSRIRRSMKEKLRLCQDVAQALAYVHGHTIDITRKDGSTETRPLVHRDLKPANILVENNRAIIADFGLAYDSSKLTRKNDFGRGTMVYMSPEQINGGMEVSPGSDVFALALVTYELFTGKRPIQGNAKTPQELLCNYHQRIPKLMHELDPKIPQELSELVNHNLTTFMPERRDSAQVFGQQLEEIANLPEVREEASVLRLLRKHAPGKEHIVP